jgi:hypothetical protein
MRSEGKLPRKVVRGIPEPGMPEIATRYLDVGGMACIFPMWLSAISHI